MTGKKWVKIPTYILDDPNWGLLPDHQWRERIEAMINNPKYIRHESLRLSHKEIKRLKSILYKGYGKRCNYCGSKHKLELDHIIPLSRGGSHRLSNLQILCRSCNAKKGARLP
jgi:5-methylcytosine-specific restriction endonuclease McrA